MQCPSSVYSSVKELSSTCAHRFGEVVEDVVLEGESLILGTWNASVEQVDVITLD
jgi:hypothetical protein